MKQPAKSQSTTPKSPTTVDEYLAGVPEAGRAALERVRATIRSVVPGATEVISYGMPTVRHNGRMLIAYGARKDGLSLYGMSANLQKTHAEALRGVEFAPGTKGTVHFSAKKPIPAAAVKALVRARLAEVAGQQAAKRPAGRATTAKPAAKNARPKARPQKTR